MQPVHVLSAARTQLIPYGELAPGQAAAIRNEIIGRIVAEVQARTRLSIDKLVVRDIRAKDDITLYTAAVSAAVEDWGMLTGTTADAYETMATGTVADQRWLGIFGVKTSPDVSCTALKFNVGGGDRAIWQLQALNEEDGYVGFTPFGVVMTQNSPYTISRFVRQASSSAFIILKGVVVEPRGKVISP